jgi:hypothetical protein
VLSEYTLIFLTGNTLMLIDGANYRLVGYAEAIQKRGSRKLVGLVPGSRLVVTHRLSIARAYVIIVCAEEAVSSGRSLPDQSFFAASRWRCFPEHA